MVSMKYVTMDALAAARPAGPFPRVLAGIDFSPASLAAARWALEHLAPGADVLLAHVVPFEDTRGPEPRDGVDAVPVDPLHDIGPALRGGLGGFAATLGVGEARTVVRVGRPSYWLDRLAARHDASLVLLGRRLDAKRKRIGEASVVERLARRTRAAVLVVPEGTPDAPRCVVAGIDDGASGAEVLAAATALATSRGLPLIALHVLAPASGTYDRNVGARGRAADKPEGDSLTHGDGGFTLAVGDVAREIVSAGIAHGGGVLVLGKRGADEAPVGSLGSVARDLLATSPLPVLLIDTGGPWHASRPAGTEKTR